MKPSDWKLIYELHKTPNMTRVAGILYITQSAVTKQVQHIEKELDTKIIRRTPAGLEFTESGIFLAEQAEKYLKLEEETFRGLETLKGLSAEKLVIGSAYTFSKYRLPEKNDEDRKKPTEDEPGHKIQDRDTGVIAGIDTVGSLAAWAASEAILRGVRSAVSAYGYPAVSDVHGQQ